MRVHWRAGTIDARFNEFGHALGLDHVDEADAIMNEQHRYIPSSSSDSRRGRKRIAAAVRRMTQQQQER